jgi:hypothetical protein
MSFGPLTARSQYFWEVFEADMPVIESGNFNAIVGTGPQYTAILEAEEQANYSTDMVAQFLENGDYVPADVQEAAVESNEFAQEMSREPALLNNLDCSIFSVCLGEAPFSPGWFIWNDHEPPASSKAFVSVPVTAKRNWGAKLTAVKLGDTVFGCPNGCGAIFDSGTSLIAAPTNVYDRLRSNLEAINFDCSRVHQLPSLTFEINDVTLVLPPHVYVGEAEGSVSYATSAFFPNNHATGKCALLLMRMGTQSQMGPMWIIGMPFFRHYYATFRRSGPQNDRMMYFAHAGSNCTVNGSMHYHETSMSMMSHRIRKIDLSKINVPRWLQNMVLKKYQIV